MSAPVRHERRWLVEGAFLRLSWWEWGPADGAPVLCVHGLTRQGRDFDVIAAALAADGRRVLAVDLPGRGYSDWLPRGELYVYPTYLVALSHLMLMLGREVDWIGTSLGGICGMLAAAAADAPVRRMVINDVGPLIPAAALARIRDYVGWEPRFDSLAELEAHLRKVHAPFGALSDAEWQAMAAHSARYLPDGRITFHYDPGIAGPVKAGPLKDVELWEAWGRIRCPRLVVRGAESDLLLADTFARMRADGAKGHEVAGAGHAPMLNDPATIAAIRAFFAA